MMETTDLRQCDHSPSLRRLHCSTTRSVLLQRKVRPALVIVIYERLDVPVERSLVNHDHMVQTLAANRSDHPLDVGSLPGRARSREHLLDAQILDLLGEVRTEDSIAITQQILRNLLKREGLPNLLRGPLRRRMSGDVEMHDSSSVMRQNQEHVQYLEPQGGHREEVDGHHRLQV